MTPGIKSTEFWLTLATSAWAAFGHLLPPGLQAIVLTVVPGVYTIARTAAKVITTLKPPPQNASTAAVGKMLTGG